MASQEAPRYRAAKVQRRCGGHGTEEAGGRRGQGSCCPQLSFPCPPPRPKGRPGSEGHQEESKERDEEVQIQAIDRRGLEEGLCTYLCPCGCVGTLRQTHTVVRSPPLFSHTQGQRDQTSLWPIFIFSEQSLFREGDPRDAPEQILASSMRRL